MLQKIYKINVIIKKYLKLNYNSSNWQCTIINGPASSEIRSVEYILYLTGKKQEKEMKKLSKWLTSLLLIAMALTMFGSTALAEDGEDAASSAEGAALKIGIGLSTKESKLDGTKFTDNDEYVFKLTKDGEPTTLDGQTGPTWESVTGFIDGETFTKTGNLAMVSLFEKDAFPVITFTQSGVYKFIISEVSTTNNNLDIDPDPVYLTVRVGYGQEPRSLDASDDMPLTILSKVYTKNDETMDYAAFVQSTKSARSSLTIQKIDQDGSPLAGAEFRLRFTDGDSEGTTLTTIDDGTAVFENLESGFYILTETPPENYTSNIPEEGIMIGIDKNADGSVSLKFYNLAGDEDSGNLTEEDLKAYGISVADDGSLVVTNTLKDVPVEPVPETPEVTTASTSVNTGVADTNGTLLLIVTVLAAASVAAVIVYRKRYEA